jgi:hypothetical protein
MGAEVPSTKNRLDGSAQSAMLRRDVSQPGTALNAARGRISKLQIPKDLLCMMLKTALSFPFMGLGVAVGLTPIGEYQREVTAA